MLVVVNVFLVDMIFNSVNSVIRDLIITSVHFSFTLAHQSKNIFNVLISFNSTWTEIKPQQKDQQHVLQQFCQVQGQPVCGQPLCQSVSRQPLCQPVSRQPVCQPGIRQQLSWQQLSLFQNWKYSSASTTPGGSAKNIAGQTEQKRFYTRETNNAQCCVIQ